MVYPKLALQVPQIISQYLVDNFEKWTLVKENMFKIIHSLESSFISNFAISNRPADGQALEITELGHLGWGTLSQFHLFLLFFWFEKYWLTTKCHVHIWQMSLQLSCGDICQIWKWFENSNMCFCKMEWFPNREINEWSFSNSHPVCTRKI